MRHFIAVIIAATLLTSCQQTKKPDSIDQVNWEKRTVNTKLPDTLETGATFLSIYSQIFLRTLNDQAELTSTVSLHNPNIKHNIYINSAIYYNTQGEPIRTYFNKTIYIRPMETVQIVIAGIDNEGGTGANFVFDWSIEPGTNEPIMEAIMISTYSSQGISFVTTGKRIK